MHRPLIRADDLLKIVWRGGARSKSQPTEEGVVSLGIVCRLNRQGLLLAASKLGLQRVGDCFGDFALDSKDIDQLAVVGIGPQIEVVATSMSWTLTRT